MLTKTEEILERVAFALGDHREVKVGLTRRIQKLDITAETRLLTIQEWEERIDVEHKLEDITISEDIFWKQRAGTKWVLQGDTNSHFYHQFASGRRRKNTISVLSTEDGEVRGQQEITTHIVDFYKKLFGPSETCNMSLGVNFWPTDTKLSSLQRTDLVKPFEKEEIKQVVMSLRENSAPGPNGFGPGFFKKCWDIYNKDMYDMFQDFHRGALDIKRLNFGVITLVPKLKEANTIKQYRPICLLNVDYKCLTKLLTNRLVPVAQKIIDKNQTGFIKGRNILGGVVVVHEVLHELRSSKKKGVILKIDFEKAYDRVNWNFLEQVMMGKGFPVQWISWVMSTVKGGKVCINFNGERSHFFSTHRGLRQGDPLSPLLFNLVANALGVMLQKAIDKGHIKRVLEEIIPGDFSYTICR